MPIDLGQKAPHFFLPTDNGKEISLETFIGKYIILFIYPKDDTSGCTQECIDFTKYRQKFDELGVVLLGLSKDSIQSHEKFILKHQLNITLLSDETCKILEAYDVWKEKSMYGKKYMGAERTTFIINPEGNIVKIYSKVKVPDHVETVYNDIKSLL